LTCSTDCYAVEATNTSGLDKGTLSISNPDSLYCSKGNINSMCSIKKKKRIRQQTIMEIQNYL